MSDLTCETIAKLQALTRSEWQTVKVYGNYNDCEKDAYYNDKQGCYEIREESAVFNVSNIESLEAFVHEDLKRRKNETGEMASMTFTQEGGFFSSDDNFYEKRGCDFKRELSAQWQILSKIINKTFDHEEFLLILQSLKQSISNFNSIYPLFSRIRIIGRSQTTSTPLFVDNEAEQGYKIKYSIQGGKEEEDILPSGFCMQLQYAKGSEKQYLFAVETLFVNTGANKIAVRIVCPDFETIEEEAILDEVEHFRQDCEKYTDLMILESY